MSTLHNSLEIALKNLPESPGIYRFYDNANELLYIGKAKNLKNRVKSYFQDTNKLFESRGQRIILMVSQIFRLDYTVVKNEKESLILEANLIHSLQPKYNVSLKDDKSYTYIRVTLGDQIPGIFLVRQKFDSRSLYFGPYTKKFEIEQVLRVIRLIFPFCQERKFINKPCQYVGLHQCDGICDGKESPEDYKSKIDQIIKILSGQTKPVKKFLETKMKSAVETQNYALASLWRDRLKTLDEVLISQKVVLAEPLDIDMLSMILETQEDGQILGSVFYQAIREGKVNNVLNYLMSGSTEQESELEFLSKYCLSFYYKLLDLPDKLYIQVFQRDKLSGELLDYSLQETEVEVLQELLPDQIKVLAI